MFMGRCLDVCCVQIATVMGVLILSVMNLSLKSTAQTTPNARESLPETFTGTPEESSRGTAERGAVLFKRFTGDQKAIWTSPLFLRRSDAEWALPALAGTG